MKAIRLKMDRLTESTSIYYIMRNVSRLFSFVQAKSLCIDFFCVFYHSSVDSLIAFVHHSLQESKNVNSHYYLCIILVGKILGLLDSCREWTNSRSWLLK